MAFLHSPTIVRTEAVPSFADSRCETSYERSLIARGVYSLAVQFVRSLAVCFQCQRAGVVRATVAAVGATRLACKQLIAYRDIATGETWMVVHWPDTPQHEVYDAIWRHCERPGSTLEPQAAMMMVRCYREVCHD